MSSDYWGDDDAEFLALLGQVVLSGDAEQYTANTNAITCDSNESLQDQTGPSRKRPRSPESQSHSVIALVDNGDEKSTYLKSNTYGASTFGDFGQYMHRKRAKLQIQNAEMDVEEDGSSQKSRIFNGLQIYINGWTEPSVQDLRKLILQHGGIYHAYLDKKSLITHIVTCSLTPAKIKEFQHMKIVRPDWLVKSVEAGALLPWHEFIYKPGARAEAQQGKMVAQKTLMSSVVSQRSKNGPSRSLNETLSPVALKNTDGTYITTSAPAPEAGPSTPPHTPQKQKSTTNSPAKLLYVTDPRTPEEAKRVPGYAADKSNLAAQRAMADPAWRAAHTSIAPDFIEGYYRNSRLHHLSTWKAELRNLVAEAQERAEGGLSVSSKLSLGAYSHSNSISKIMQENMDRKGWASGSVDELSMKGAQLVKKSKGKGKERATDPEEDKIIMHCDFDSFFVAAGLVERPNLRGKPVVVCHSQGAQGGQSSTSEIASASYEARQFGIRNGMSLQQARKLCPEIQTIPYEFQKYKQLSLQFYTILMAHADDLQAVSVDEALIEVTSSVRRIETEISSSQDDRDISSDPAKDFAEAIRAQVKKATGCEVSIGISYNIMLARLATRRAKPGGSFHLRASNVAAFLEPMDIDDLHGFGHSAHQKTQEKLGTTNLGVLTKKSRAVLCEALGKGTGETLYNALRGIDRRKLESDKPRKSVSCDINYGIRFENNEQAEAFVHQLAEEVSKRLTDIDMCARSLTLKIMKRDPAAPVEAPKFMGHGLCESFTKQAQMVAPGGRATRDAKIIGEHCWRLLKSFNFDPKELRGVGVQVQKLEPTSVTANAASGQARLPFKPVVSPRKPQSDKIQVDEEAPTIVVQPPLQEPPAEQLPVDQAPPAAQLLDLPSFSQVDMTVFQELPEDVRRELEAEYKRRSTTPDIAQEQNGALVVSVSPEPKGNITVKGVNVKRITRQLAPRSRASMSPKKNKLFAKLPAPTQLKISQAELRKLGLDPAVFAILSVDLQREQLAYARQQNVRGGPGHALGGEKKVLKPVSRARPLEGGVVVPRPPPPQAKHPALPTLKQQGKTKGEKLYFTETDDVQNVIEVWVESFAEHPPNQKDVEFFAKFLVQCVDSSRSTDSGVEKAVAVLKWWLVLLRRHFSTWEHESDDPFLVVVAIPGTSEFVGRAWWKAFRDVKEQMDTVARRKFGGCLSLR